jgi:predicted amidohydrolase YtcJ
VRRKQIALWTTIGIAIFFAVQSASRRGGDTNAKAGAPDASAGSQMNSSSGNADLALINGVIYTGDAKQPRVEAVASTGEKIIATGTTAEIRKSIGPKTRVIDLHGGFAMPGFNDAHLHLGSAGQAKLHVDLEGAKSIEEFQRRVRAKLATTKSGEWITGRGWDHTLWAPAKFPTKQDLDAVSRDIPMMFTHISGHVAVVNSKALEIAGITRATPDPHGAAIRHDANGEPDGMLEEDAAMSIVARKIPRPTQAQIRNGIELALQDAVSHGVTSMQDNSSWEDFLTYRALKNEGKLPVRITEWLPFDASVEQLEAWRKDGGTTDPWLKTGMLKGFMDGALGSTTAALLAPYTDDPSTSGLPRYEQAALNAKAIERDKAGFQLGFHAIGDRANRMALDAFEAVAKANGPRDRRDRIEHAQVIAPEDFARFASLHVIASMQPSHETTDMRWAEKRLGPERVKGAYAWRTLLNDGVTLAFGTDWPVEIVNPMRGLHACVTRELTEGGPAGGWQPQEKISMDECIRAYTVGSAYAEFEEGKKGQIVPGQYADIIVLSDDVTKIAPTKIAGVTVVQTMVGGKTVFEKKQ